MTKKLQHLKRCKVCGKKRVPPAGSAKTIYYRHWRVDGFCSRLCAQEFYANDGANGEQAA